MRILFLSHYFPPEVNAPANRTFEHCRAWAAAGHDVHVVTCVPSHPVGRPFPGFRRAWYRHEQIDGVHVHRVWTYLAANRGLVRRTMNFLSFVPSAIFRSWRLGRFDVVIGTSPQFFCAVAAWGAAALRQAPWVFELRDLWPESIATVGAMRRSMALRLLERLELRMYAEATGVVCVTQPFMGNLAMRGVNPAKLHYVPNGIVTSFWSKGVREAGRVRLGLTADEVAVSYVGTIGMAHGLGVVLDAARLLEQTHPQVKLFVIGDGAELEQLRETAVTSRLTNVIFTGMLPHGDIADIMAATDIALVTLKPADTFNTVLPSKMFEAMAAGRPIVLAVRGEAQRVLEQAGAGVAVSPGSATALADAVGTLADRTDLRAQFGASGASFVAREFSREVWACRYIEMLESLVSMSVASSASGRAAASPIRPDVA